MDDFVVHQLKGRHVPLTALIAQSVVSTHQPPVHSHQSSAARPLLGTIARNHCPEPIARNPLPGTIPCLRGLSPTILRLIGPRSTLAASSATRARANRRARERVASKFSATDEIERTRTAILGRAGPLRGGSGAAHPMRPYLGAGLRRHEQAAVHALRR
jgi:hypothetical protein